MMTMMVRWSVLEKDVEMLIENL